MRTTLLAWAWACMPTAFALLINTPVNATSGQVLELTWNRDPNTVVFYATKDFTSFTPIGVAPTGNFETSADLSNVPAGSGYIIVAYAVSGEGPFGSTQKFTVNY
ncbi:hypothetical protein BB8028_0005g01480 [Beauveria bassiana]|uniref:Uncharacterized protein n=1 Tax=Beauveria bassiana TaxID=176275 RepID=A0A2S7YEV2_BEABA|nr:hypothetical protein BB8028_0005g01480 [Beauveria bassiana]